MKITLSSLMLMLPLAVAAQNSPRVAGPVSGIVYDRAAQALRPMVGVPGASYLGDALISGLDAAAVSPSGDLALASIEGRVVLVSGLLSAAPATTLLEVVAGDRFQWSPDGSWAAVYSSRAGQAQTIRDIRANPAPGALVQVPADPTVFGLSNGGELLAGSQSGLYLLAAGSAPRQVAPVESPSSVAFLRSGVFAASGDQIWLIENFASSPAASLFAEGAGFVVGLQVSLDGKRLFAADSQNRLLRAYDVAARASAGQAELDCSPSELTAFGGRNLWLLNSDSNGSDPLWVGTGPGDPQAWFVPAGRAQ